MLLGDSGWEEIVVLKNGSFAFTRDTRRNEDETELFFSSNIRLGRFLALITRPLGGQQLPTLGRPYNNSTTVRGLPLYLFEVI